MADDPEEEGLFSGQIKNKSGLLMMYIKIKNSDTGRWVNLANFTITPKFHSINELDDGTSYMIFQCQVKDGSSFNLPLTAADLDRDKSVLDVLDPLKRPHNGTIDKEKLFRGTGKGKLNSFIKYMIKKYKEDIRGQSPAIVTKACGFISLKINDVNVRAYCLGPNSIVPIENQFAPQIEAMPKIWIGQFHAEKFVLPPMIGVDSKNFIRRVVEYHGVNGPSPLCALGYCWIMMYKPQLHSRGLKVGIAHVVGDVNTGKTAKREMVEYVMPRLQTKEGLGVKEEPTLSVYSLQQKIHECRQVIIQDPPCPDFEKMNTFMDQFFENKTELKHSFKKEASSYKPSCGAIFVWPHEEQSLDKFSLTAITKSVIFLHRRNNFPYEKFVELEKAWRDEIPSASGLFKSLLQEIDFEKLKTDSDSLVMEYHKELEKNYPPETLNQNNRLLRQYAIVVVATQMWLRSLDLPEFQAEVDKYIRETCIPYVFRIIEEKKTGNVTMLESCEEKLVRIINELSDHEFLCQITAPEKIKNVQCIGFVQAIYFGSKNIKSLICSLSTDQARKSVLSQESKELWFKRDATSHLYGKSRRVEVHLCPVSTLPSKLKEALTNKFRDLLPDVPDVTLSDNIKKLMDETFGKIYLPQTGPKASLHKTLAKLNDQETEQVKEYAEELIRKRRTTITDEESSGEEEESNEQAVEVEGLSASQDPSMSPEKHVAQEGRGDSAKTIENDPKEGNSGVLQLQTDASTENDGKVKTKKVAPKKAKLNPVLDVPRKMRDRTKKN